MREKGIRVVGMSVLAASVPFLAAVACGCGGAAAGAYRQAVLEGWSRLRAAWGEL